MDAARDEGVRSRAPHRSGAWGPRRLLGDVAREVPPGAQRGPGLRRPGHGAWIADLALIALFAVVLRGPTLSVSVLSPDESLYILMAREVLLGHLPYLGMWDHKPLGSTMLIAGAMAVFGESVETVRVLALACVVATGWSLRAITSRIVPGRLPPEVAGLLYVAF